MQQAGKQVEETDKQRDRGHDVIGFTTTDDLLCLPQDQARHQQYKHARYCQPECRYLEKIVADCSKECHQDTDGKKFTHK